ncbi:MAG: hypothetical protein ACLGHQ_08530 [Acidimicrobiia bacterium]
MTFGSIAVVGIAVTGSIASPSELVLDELPGFERSGAPATDLGFAEFAAVEPDSVIHLAPDSEQAAGLVAAVEAWDDVTAGSRLVIELVLAIDEKSATTFVDQAAANAIALGLAATDPPFVGAWSYSGGLDDWTNMVSWNQGPYAVTLTQSSVGELDRSAIDDAALRQAELIFETTGLEVSDDAAVDEEAPSPPTDVPPTTDAPPAADGDGNDAAYVVGAIAVVAALAAGLVLLRRRRGATVDP